MKKIIFMGVVLGFSLTSCMKSKTCTCKDGAGNVGFQQTKKTNSKKDLQKFEDDCKQKKTEVIVNNVVIESIPCEIS